MVAVVLPIAYTAPKVWPVGFSISVPKFDSINPQYDGGIVFQPRAPLEPTQLSDAYDIYRDVFRYPLSIFDFALTSPYMTGVEISFTTSGPVPLTIGLLSYVKSIYTAQHANPTPRLDYFDAAGSSSTAEVTYTGSNTVTLSYNQTDANVLGRIAIDRNTSVNLNFDFTVTKIKFLYPAVVGGGGGGGGGGSVGGGVKFGCAYIVCGGGTFTPTKQGYAFTLEAETKVFELEGGNNRYRRDFIGANTKFQINWVLKRTEYAYLTDLIKKQGKNSIKIPLILDNPNALSCLDAYLIPGSLKLVSISGLNYNVTCTVEAKPIAFNATWPAEYQA